MSQVKESRGGNALAEAVKRLYAAGQTDYSLEPLVRLDAAGQPEGRIADGDSVIFCCRRGEREVELTEAFTQPDFPHFARPKLDRLTFVILTLYHEKFKDLPVAFAPSMIPDTLGETLSRAGLSQFRTAESEKFAHITFFLNGGNNQPFSSETDVRIPSPRGVPMDSVPALSLPAVADQVLGALAEGYDLVLTNFANGDVIGHTANAAAKVACAEVVDEHLGRVVQAALAAGYVVMVTADHGNLEVMLTPEGAPHVAHTTNLVPFIVIDPRTSQSLPVQDGALCDIAPTMLKAMGVPQPAAMTGASRLPDYDWGGQRKVLLVILDGWGLGAHDGTNPIHLAHTPFWDRLTADYPPARLQASGEAVGLQPGKAGNSEAGHMNIGAGRVVPQDDVRLDQAMQDGAFETNPVFLSAIRQAKARGASLHLLALLTEKSSHGSIDYPLAILRMAKAEGLDRVYVHVIFDGRSTEPGSAPDLLVKLDRLMDAIGVGLIVDGVGRGIALDRDGNYGKIQRTFDALVHGKGITYTEA